MASLQFDRTRKQFVIAGVHPKTLQRLLGHSNVNLTMKYYTHLKAEDEIAAADALPDLVAKDGQEAAARPLAVG